MPDSETQHVNVTMMKKEYSVMIQTDKAVYKPGDEVKFRVFLINPDGTPVSSKKIKNLHIELRNKYDEKIQALTYEPYTRMVYTNQLKLNEHGFIGTYRIYVWPNYDQENGKYKSEEDELEPDEVIIENVNLPDTLNSSNAVYHEFEVEKYVLPEFKVYIETKRNVRQGENIILKTYAMYPTGKFATGTAYIEGIIKTEDTIQREFRKEVKVTTKETISISLEEDLKLANYILQYDIEFKVRFEELLTKQQHSATTKVSILTAERKFSLIIHPESDTFVPGQNLIVDVFMKDEDGKFLEKSTKYLEFTVSRNYKTKRCSVIKEKDISSKTESQPQLRIQNGKARFVINVPENTTSMVLKATYDKNIVETFNIIRKVSVSRDYIKM